ncbi:MAG TPA: hypothetical protein PJ994_03840 [Tepidiformaceae bacterium]|nr:hypothetical protein [Tepidiformaceae bacterium]
MEYGIRTGLDVFTRDGTRLGEVKELRGEYFKVDAPMAPDYWLSLDCIRGGGAAVPERGAVEFGGEETGGYKRDID